MRATLTGDTSPPAMSRVVASPEAETPSYSPLCISCTISSDVLPTRTLTWQPVASSNGVTQSTSGSVEPSSTYPAHAIRLTSPSPSPSSVGAPSGTPPAGADPGVVVAEVSPGGAVVAAGALVAGPADVGSVAKAPAT